MNLTKLLLPILLATSLPLHAEDGIVTADQITHALTPKRSIKDTTAQRQQTFSEQNYRSLNPGLDPKDRGIRIVPNGNSQQATVTVDQSAMLAFDNIRFKLDSVELADDRSEAQLREIAKSRVNFKEKTFVLEGHTCDLGEKDYNQKLSERRAHAIGQWLRAHGVQCELIPFGFGETDPKVENTSESARAQNRRVVITLKAA